MEIPKAHAPPARFFDPNDGPVPHIATFQQYKDIHAESLKNSVEFWKKTALENLDWIVPFNDADVRQGGFLEGEIAWFSSGTVNVAYNCIDRHAAKDPNAVAIIFEADEPGNHEYITFGNFLRHVCRIAHVLKKFGVKKGDTVCIYMPVLPEAVYAMLACAKICAIHKVIFAGFSADAVRDRVIDAKSKILITANQSLPAVGISDNITGQAVVTFCTLKSHHADEASIVAALRLQVHAQIGAFATPKAVVIVSELPKTRSGKILRRILRKVVGGEITVADIGTEDGIRNKLGDISTLADPGIVNLLVEKVKKVTCLFHSV
ncbi:acetyl-CoA synthetase [Physocladia obscura]|uniref:acetate--CoA ligase n=1 Tax=Physocladia obscura TaxID=109957 RepID=A0AAD5XN10_9FUNG|nr:acetyl-CoA synthetase [Physocladia obscura]